MNLILLSKKLRFIFFLRSFSFTSLFMTVLLRITEFVNVTFLNDCPLFPQIYKPMIPNATRIYRTKTRDTFGIIKLLSFVYNFVLLRERGRERDEERERERKLPIEKAPWLWFLQWPYLMTGRWYFQQIVLTSSAIESQVSLIMVQTRYWLPERAQIFHWLCRQKSNFSWKFYDACRNGLHL